MRDPGALSRHDLSALAHRNDDVQSRWRLRTVAPVGLMAALVLALLAMALWPSSNSTDTQASSTDQAATVNLPNTGGRDIVRDSTLTGDPATETSVLSPQELGGDVSGIVSSNWVGYSPGAAAGGTIVTQDDLGKQYMAMHQYPGSVEDAMAYYIQQLEADGFIVKGKSQSESPTMLIIDLDRANDDGCNVSSCQVILAPGATGTDVLFNLAR